MYRFVNLVLILGLLSIFHACKQKNQVVNDDNIVDTLFESSYNEFSNNIDSIYLIAQRLDSLTKNSSQEQKAKAGICYARYYRGRFSYQLSKAQFEKSIALLDTSKLSLTYAKALAGLGNVYQDLGDYPKALDCNFKSIRAFKENKYKIGESSVLANIGQIYQLKGDINLAADYIHKSMETLESNKLHKSYFSAAHTLANLYGMKGDIDSALIIDNYCLSLLSNNSYSQLVTPFYDNKANCFLYTGRLDSAQFYFYKGLMIDSMLGNKKNIGDTYVHFGLLESERKNVEEAVRWTQKGIDLHTGIGYKQGQASGWEFLSQLYKDNNQFDKALAAKDSFSFYKDLLVNERTEAKLAELKTIYETEKKDEEISFQQEKLIRQRVIILLILIVFLSFLISAFYFYQNYKRKREAELQQEIKNKENQITQAIFSSEQKERVRLARDLHDSIGQMLSVIKMHLSTFFQQQENTNTEALKTTSDLVDKTITEVRNISHNLIPVELNFGLQSALEDLAYKLNSSKKITFSLDIDSTFKNLRLAKEVELTIYRIIQEVVNNMLKHSKATEIKLNITKHESEILFNVSDNGIGFDTDLIETSKGMGWKNLITRVNLLNGKMKIDSILQKGTSIQINIPE